MATPLTSAAPTLSARPSTDPQPEGEVWGANVPVHVKRTPNACTKMLAPRPPSRAARAHASPAITHCMSTSALDVAEGGYTLLRPVREEK